MKTKSPFALGLAFLLSLIITVPADISAEPQTARTKSRRSCPGNTGGEHCPRLQDHQCFRKNAGRMAGLGEYQDRWARAYRSG